MQVRLVNVIWTAIWGKRREEYAGWIEAFRQVEIFQSNIFGQHLFSAGQPDRIIRTTSPECRIHATGGNNAHAILTLTIHEIPARLFREDVFIGECDHYRFRVPGDVWIGIGHSSDNFLSHALIPAWNASAGRELDFREEVYLYAELLRIVLSQRSHKDGLPSNWNEVQFSMAMQVLWAGHMSVFDCEMCRLNARLAGGLGRLLTGARCAHFTI